MSDLSGNMDRAPINIQQEIANYIQGEILNDTLGRNIGLSEDLLGTEMVDSMGMLRLIVFIEGRFAFKVRPEDQVIENFMSIESIVRYIQSNSEAGSD